jgi:8-oxo-dGTP pyrophosphatase MutT (NUDIX family)
MQEGLDAPIRTAATTMLVRDGHSLEVLMVKRNYQIDFFSGAMVFPGGKVEPADADEQWRAIAKGWDATPEEERSPRIAALREAFEECGVIAAAEPAPLSDEEIQNARARIEAGELSFAEFLQSHDIRPDLTRLTLFARWLTPPVIPKRFDTYFYLIEMSDAQRVVHDGRETIENEWVTPQAALESAQSGGRTLLFPTRMNLRLLSNTHTVREAVSAAQLRTPKIISPRIETRGDRRFLQLLAEDGYGVVEEAL